MFIREISIATVQMKQVGFHLLSAYVASLLIFVTCDYSRWWNVNSSGGIAPTFVA